MKRDRWLNFGGVAVLVAAFAWAVAMHFTRPGALGADGVVLRVAHRNLEPDMRAAFEEVARLYGEEQARQGRQVTVLPVAIPHRVYPTWLRTRLVGENPPDVVFLRFGQGVTEEMTGRFMLPLTAEVARPNPYNAGTDLEDVPWAETFLDNLDVTGFSTGLLDYYAVPYEVPTVRLYTNRDLLRRLTGSDELPRDFAGLVALAGVVAAHAEATGERLVVLAGSQYNSPLILDALFGAGTQRMRMGLDWDGDLAIGDVELAFTHAAGQWSLDSAGARAGLGWMRDAGGLMQPGFMQRNRDDALFYFAQGKALMIAAGSWDAASIRPTVDFPLGITRVPLPGAGAGGGQVRGAASEADMFYFAGLGVCLHSRHTAEAVDFLKFFTSRRGAQAFSDRAGVLSPVRGVDATERMREFEPELSGFAGQMRVGVMWEDTHLLYGQNAHHLFNATGSVEEFLEEMRPGYPKAIVSNLQRWRRGVTGAIGWQDAMLVGIRGLEAAGESQGLRRGALLDAQTSREIGLLQSGWALRGVGPVPRPPPAELVGEGGALSRAGDGR